MAIVTFRDRLEQEFDARRVKNARYSLRAFAALLGTDHSTLSQVLQRKRRVPITRLRTWARRIGMDGDEIAAYVAAEHVRADDVLGREQQLRHWAAEAMCVVRERAHWEIVRLCRQAEFQTDCRWIAEQAGLSVDEVNLALTRLLRLGLLEIRAGGEWRELTGRTSLNEHEFRSLALARVRTRAAEDHTNLEMKG